MVDRDNSGIPKPELMSSEVHDEVLTAFISVLESNNIEPSDEDHPENHAKIDHSFSDDALARSGLADEGYISVKIQYGIVTDTALNISVVEREEETKHRRSEYLVLETSPVGNKSTYDHDLSARNEIAATEVELDEIERQIDKASNEYDEAIEDARSRGMVMPDFVDTSDREGYDRAMEQSAQTYSARIEDLSAQLRMGLISDEEYDELSEQNHVDHKRICEEHKATFLSTDLMEQEGEFVESIKEAFPAVYNHFQILKLLDAKCNLLTQKIIKLYEVDSQNFSDEVANTVRTEMNDADAHKVIQLLQRLNHCESI